MRSDMLPGIFTIIIGIIILFISQNINYFTFSYEIISPRFFPTSIGVILLILGLCLVINNFFIIRKHQNTSVAPKQGKKGNYFRVLIVNLVILSYIYLLEWMGYISSTIIVLALLIYFFGEKNWKVNVIVSAFVTVICYYFFSKLFLIPLPEKILLIHW